MKRLVSRNGIVIAILLVFGFAWQGCGDLLEVENPNNLIEGDLTNPAAASAMANGLEASVTRAQGQILKIYATASDELTWVGSRDAFQQLDFGNTTNPFNEFTDGAFPFVAEARWLADNFVGRLEAFQSEGSLTEPENLVRTYLYKAVIYTTIADMFDDFAFSDRTEASPPVGSDNMSSLYDAAIDALNKGMALTSDGELTAQLMSMRARVKYSKALWGKLNPVGNVNTSDPLVNDAGALADAEAALAMMTPDWRFELDADAGAGLANDTGGWVNSRLEMVFSDVYVQRTADGTKVDWVAFVDMIDGVVHPFLGSFIPTWVADRDYPDMTITSAREMHLIIAEAALASGGDFTSAINALRSLDGLSEYSGQVDAQDLLIESRQANLFIQGRRLADMYRFGLTSPNWIPESDAVRTPGSFLPITAIEIRANPFLN